MSTSFALTLYLAGLIPGLLASWLTLQQWKHSIATNSRMSHLALSHPSISVANLREGKATRAPSEHDWLHLFGPAFVPVGNIGFALCCLVLNPWLLRGGNGSSPDRVQI